MKNINLTNTMKRISVLLLTLVMLISTVSVGLVAFQVESGAGYVHPADETANVLFNVPETVYVNLVAGTDSKYHFTYALDQNVNIGSKTISANSTAVDFSKSGKAKIYFSCDASSGVSISAIVKDRNGAANGSVTLTDNNVTGSGTLDPAYLTGGYVNSCASGYIEYTATYTINNVQKTAKAYTYIYAPYESPAFASTRCVNKEGDKNDLQSMAWISGIHGSVGNGNKALKTTGTILFNPMKGIVINATNTKNDGGVSQDTEDFHLNSSGAGNYNSHEENGDKDIGVQAVSPYGLFYVDKSRFSYFNQIPNFKIGFLYSYVKEGERGLKERKIQYYFSDYSGDWEKDFVSGTKNNENYYEKNKGTVINGIQYATTETKTDRENLAPKIVANNISWNKAIPLSSSYIAIKGAVHVHYQYDSDITHWGTPVSNSSNSNVVGVYTIVENKENLRNEVFKAAMNGSSSSESYVYASKILGKPDASINEIDQAYRRVKVRTATIKYTDTKNVINETDVKGYVYGENVTISSKDIPGYTLKTDTGSTSESHTASTVTNLFSVPAFMDTNPALGGKNVGNIAQLGENDLTFTSNSNGNGDNYTKQVGTDYQSSIYKIPVEPLITYRFSYNASGDSPKTTISMFNKKGEYLGLNFDLTDANLNYVVTIPADVYYLAFRFGNKASGHKDTVFNNIFFGYNLGDYTTQGSNPTGTYEYASNKWESITVNYIYRPNTYKVRYNGNGASSNNMDDPNHTYESNHTYDEAKQLSDCTYNKVYPVTFDFNGNGKAPEETSSASPFNGWTTEPNGDGNKYSNKQTVINLTATDNDIINLYAQWGTLSTITVPEAKKTGCVFTGWYDSKEGENLVLSADQTEFVAGPDTPRTLYAHWAAAVSTLEINPNGGSWENATGYIYDETDEDADDTVYRYKDREYGTTVEIPVPVRTGYTFMNWNRVCTNGTLVNNPNSSTYTFGPENGLVDVLRAIWLPNTYYVTYLSGTVSWESQTSTVKAYAFESLLTSPPIPERTSFVFDGWDKEIPKTMPAEDLVFTAQWKDEPNAEYNETVKAVSQGYAIYMEGEDYSSLHKADYVKPAGVITDDSEIVLNPFNSNKAQAVAFGVKMTTESNAYISLRAPGGYAYAVVTGTKLDEDGNPVTKVIKVTSGEKVYYDVTNLLEPGVSGYITVRPSGIADEYKSYSYIAVAELKLTTDKDNSAKAVLEAIEDEDIKDIQGLVINIPENINPIEIPEVIFEKLITKISIRKTNAASTHELDYKTTLTLYNEVENYAGKKITWYVDDGSGKFVRKASNKDGSLTLKNLVKGFKVKCVTKDADGEEVSSSVETFTVKTGLWQRIVALFRTWFRKLPNIKY